MPWSSLGRLGDGVGTGPSYVAARMLVSFVVRLAVDDLTVGSVVGEVHNVLTGEQALVRSFEELLSAFAEGAKSVLALQRTDPGEKTR